MFLPISCPFSIVLEKVTLPVFSCRSGYAKAGQGRLGQGRVGYGRVYLPSQGKVRGETIIDNCPDARMREVERFHKKDNIMSSPH